MRKVIVNNEEIYIDDTKLEKDETGALEDFDNEELEKTKELNIKDDLEDTITDLWSDEN